MEACLQPNREIKSLAAFAEALQVYIWMIYECSCIFGYSWGCAVNRKRRAGEHHLSLTQDTTLPLKHGSLALSSEISSLTTLESKRCIYSQANRAGHRVNMWCTWKHFTFLHWWHTKFTLSKSHFRHHCPPTLHPRSSVSSKSSSNCPEESVMSAHQGCLPSSTMLNKVIWNSQFHKDSSQNVL